MRPSKALRELNFGAQEGLHYDGLDAAEKARLADPDFRAPAGESWADVRRRATAHFSSLG